jgi:AhpC/TSA family
MRAHDVVVSAAILLLCLGPGAAGGPAGPEIRDLAGRMRRPFQPAGAATVLFFVATDCPIANTYAPEIQRICRDYAGRGVECLLIYEDVETATGPRLDDQVRRHLREYGYTAIDAAIDRSRTVARAAQATRTPQAVVVGRDGRVVYRGRIDNFYAALGRPRQQVTRRDLREALDASLNGLAVPAPQTEALGCHISNPRISRQ